jgi:hypothetical protein
MDTRALMGRAGLLASLLLVACTVLPEGPSAVVLPGTGKSLEQFRGDDLQCRADAQGQLGGASAQQAGVDSGVRSAAPGTGLLFGAVAGTGATDSSSYGMQRRYDNAYQQCMYASGHKVPVAGQMLSGVPANAATPPPDTPPPRY